MRKVFTRCESMKCKRCGHLLPYSGYTCTNCGMMMSIEQIKEQKQRNQDNPKRDELLSEKYGQSDFIYKEREKSKLNYLGILFMLLILLLLVLIGIFVYF